MRKFMQLNIFIMENLINQIVDAPKMVSDKIPGNITSMVEGSDRNVSKWVGMFYRIAATLFILGALYNLASPLWGDAPLPSDGKVLVVMFVVLLTWMYAAFPMSDIIRSAGETLGSSDSGIVKFIFGDLVLANIKMVGHLMAILTFFSACLMTLGWAIDQSAMGMFSSAMGENSFISENISWMFDLPMVATADFANWVGFEGVAGVIQSWSDLQFTVESGEAQSWAGLVQCCWAFAGVVLVLAQLYVSLAIYSFLFGLATSFMNWFKNPYLPTKSV